jgi:hypothetical protein
MSPDDSGRPRKAEAPDDDAPRWDADDERRLKDCFAPPKDPCECWCMHCRRVFTSDGIWFQRVINDPQGFEGFWKCPTPNCGGAGFTFDIFPTDPEHPANGGWHFDDGDEDEDPEGGDAEWDPDEPEYQALDEELGDEDEDDLEGEEWKYGLQPGERPPEPQWAEQARRQWEEDEARYDQPDERPRVIDWNDREDRSPVDDGDIPF